MAPVVPDLVPSMQFECRSGNLAARLRPRREEVPSRVYTILVSVLLGCVVGVVYTLLGFWKTWAMGIILGTLVALLAFILISRQIAKRLQPSMDQVGKQLQSGASQAAMKTLEGLMPMARWQVLLSGQLHAQMGIIALVMDKEDLALVHLGKAGLRVPDAQIARAALLYRRKKVAEAKDVLDVAIRANKKQMMLYHVYAYILNKEGEREAAIAKAIGPEKAKRLNNEFDIKEGNPLGGGFRMEARVDAEMPDGR